MAVYAARAGEPGPRAGGDLGGGPPTGAISESTSEPPDDDADAARLVEALWAADVDEIERLGQGLGARGLAPMLAAMPATTTTTAAAAGGPGSRREGASAGEPARARVLAAIAAAGAAPDAWLLLSRLAALAAGPDRRIAAEAARAAVRAAQATTRDRALELDIPADALRVRLAAWRGVGARADLWPDVRVAALEIGVALTEALGPGAGSDAGSGPGSGPGSGDAPFDLTARLADPDPEVRRAALELGPHPLPPAARVRAADMARGDPDPVVAAVAAEVLCADDDPPAGAGDGRDGAPALLGGDGVARLRALVSGRGEVPLAWLPPSAILGVARCLAADSTADSRRALRALAASAPRAVREPIRRLGATKPR